MTTTSSNYPSLSSSFNGVSDRFRREWESLRQEDDPELFTEGLLHLAQSIEASGDEGRAAVIYAGIANGQGGIAAAESIRRRALGRSELLLGRGSVAARSEYLLRHFCQNAADPSAIFAMGAAGAVFRMTRLGVLAQFGSRPASSLLAQKWIAPSVAGLAAFALEAPAFSLTNRMGGILLGRERHGMFSGLSTELAAAYLTLGGLRLGGILSSSLSRGLFTSTGAQSSSAAISRHFLNQSGVFAGILLGHTLETHAGLRPASDGVSTLLDSAATFLHFHVGGRFAQHAFGPRMEAWEQGLDRRFRELSAPLNFPNDFFPQSHFPNLIPELAGARMEGAAVRIPHYEPMLMVGRPDGSTERVEATAPGENLREELRQRVEILRARVAEAEPGSIRVSRLTEEADWLENAPQDDLIAFFQKSLNLRAFYTRNLAHGTRDGLLWLKGMEERLFSKVRASDDYREFIRHLESETPHFEFPNYFIPPSTLPEMGSERPSVISITNAQNGLQETLAYYRIRDLFTIQEVVSVGKVAEYREAIHRGDDFPRNVQVGLDSRRTRWYLMDGHHRAAAAFLEGRAYILASTVRSFVVAQSPQRVHDLKHVSREEYDAVALRNQYGAGMSDSGLVTELESLESLTPGGRRSESGVEGNLRSSWSQVLRRIFSRR